MPFFGTLHSNGYIFHFLPCLSHCFFSQLFVSPPWTTILPFCISFFLFSFFLHTHNFIIIIIYMYFYFTILYWFCISFSGVGLVVLHYLPKFAQMHAIESVVPSNHLILCCPLVLLLSVFPSIRAFSKELTLCIR